MQTSFRMPQRGDEIGIDGDGVMFDFNDAYGFAWEKAFGYRPKLIRPDAYHAMDAYDVPYLDAAGRQHLNSVKMDEFWETMKPLPGAVEACQILTDTKARLVCISALPVEFESHRQRNADALGLNIVRTYATGEGGANPKAVLLAQLRPAFFVDNFLDYLQDVDRQHTHCALIEPGLWKTPNFNESMQAACTTHFDLLAFARWYAANI